MAETVPLPPEIIAISNSRLVLANDGSGFLIDCGGTGIINELRKLKASGKLKSVDDVFVTHYHDDHTDALPLLVSEFGPKVHACGSLVDLIEHPGEYRLPWVRLHALNTIASNVNAPGDALKARGISHAVIFTAGLFVDQQCIAPTRHFVYFRPNNDPGLQNDILWANHLGWQDDFGLMKWFPGRTGYLMTWEGCRPRFMRLQ